MLSRPSRARELKLPGLLAEVVGEASRPSRARELKLAPHPLEGESIRSRPSRARELKPTVDARYNAAKGRAPRGRVS